MLQLRQLISVCLQALGISQIEVPDDISLQHSLSSSCGESLELMKQVYSRTGWNREEAVWGICIAAGKGNLGVIEWICATGARVDTIQAKELINGSVVYPPLFWAARAGRIGVMQWLIANGADIHKKDGRGQTALHKAAWRGELTAVKFLVYHGSNINEKDKYGQTALHGAAKADRLSVAQWLVENGSCIDEKLYDGRTALHIAANSGHLKFMDWLVANSVNINEADYKQQTALHTAAMSGQLSAVKWLSLKGAVVGEKTALNQTALHLAAAASKLDIALLQYLVECGLRAFERDCQNFTPVYYAIVGRKFTAVQFFLTECVKREKPTETDLHHVLFVAANANDVSILELLKKLGVKIEGVNYFRRSTLHEAAAGGVNDVVDLLLDNGVDVNVADNFGMTPLIEASRRGHSYVLRRLIDGGGDVSATNLARRNALHYAAEEGHIDAVQILLNDTINLNDSDRLGWTALHCAAASGFLQIVEILTLNGANVDMRTFLGKTALTLAIERDHHAVVQHLLQVCDASLRLELANHGSMLSADNYKDFILDRKEIQGTLHKYQNNANGFWLGSPIEVRNSRKNNLLEKLGWLSRLNHPHIAKLYGVYHEKDDGVPYMVYERAIRGSLLEYIGRCQGGNVWSNFYEAALGLQYLHDRNIIHGAICCGSIVIAANNVVKLQNVGMDPRYNGNRQPWRAPEVLAGFQATFESDVYDFGMAILQAFKNARDPWNLPNAAREYAARFGSMPARPASLLPSQWELIKRMCHLNPLNRPSVADIVRELEVFAHEYNNDNPSFGDVSVPQSWTDLGDVRVDIESCLEATITISSLLEEVQELTGKHSAVENVNGRVLKRLLDIFNQLKHRADTPQKHIVHRYCSIICYFHRRLRTTTGEGSIQAVHATKVVVDDAFSVHGDLDLFLDYAGLSCSSRIHKWRDYWRNERRMQEHLVLSKLKDAHIFSHDTTSCCEDRENMFASFGCQFPRGHGTDKSTGIDSVAFRRSPDWYIAASEVDFNKYTAFASGSFGSVHRGTWKHAQVVVKKLTTIREYKHQLSFSESYPSTTCAEASVTDAEQDTRVTFFNEVEIWYKLYHPNVLQLFGACHVNQMFFVCEYAGHGQLNRYLRDHPSELWGKLYEAALGLRYLHSRHVVHGDLKCNNILVGDDGQAKLADFGLSKINTNKNSCLPTAASGTSRRITSGAIRWKAPEVLRGEKSSFASDIYSFGMCILEAVSGEYPWGATLPDVAIRYHVVRKKKIPMCPSKCSEEAYNLVRCMCQYTPTERIGMNEVVDVLNRLRYVSNLSQR